MRFSTNEAEKKNAGPKDIRLIAPVNAIIFGIKKVAEQFCATIESR